MQPFVQQMIEKKIKNLSSSELLNYAQQYQINLTRTQANEIVTFLRSTDLNPLEQADRVKLLKKLAQITDLKTAQQAQQLFNQIIKQYGVESWFN
ncbi:hypothetical protein GCM10011351_16940 [Paraliobacillus quinghaiensis]|uniref:DUF2624 domain-containing protein n=1 Tax=Paraliobacillus quinghaiensis TaxID=470815 RepID=A0A917TP68_9BACI|nr:DUF2624 family protein [Paraliobacillus quinghaiensis]GGM31416.1 hypothetical protein GCM10011351_16940 [Paraliobacillus quinghaiensis]